MKGYSLQVGSTKNPDDELRRALRAMGFTDAADKHTNCFDDPSTWTDGTWLIYVECPTEIYLDWADYGGSTDFEKWDGTEWKFINSYPDFNVDITPL